MNNVKISQVRKLSGTVSIPGDKSISHRAIMIGSLANGPTRIKNFPASQDCIHTIKAFQSLGINIESKGSTVVVNGRGPQSFKPAPKEIYLGNSGTSMRLISGILAGQPFETILTGDSSLSGRPMDRIIKPLRMMGAEIKARRDNLPPLAIKGGKLKPIQYSTPIASAQVKSAIMFAALYVDGVTSVIEPAKSRNHTERMLEYFGAGVTVDGLKVSIKGPIELVPKPLEIPGDISSAAFFIGLAAILDVSKITLSGILYNTTRMGFIENLIKMGADIAIKNVRPSGPEQVCDIRVNSAPLKAIEIGPESIPKLIDELPILMVCACFADGQTRIRGASELRVKETDRINSMTSNLKKMGARISVEGDDIAIVGTGSLRSAELDSFGDHRTAMSMVIAGLAAKGESIIKDIDCINTSFPHFFEILTRLGIKKARYFILTKIF